LEQTYPLPKGEADDDTPSGYAASQFAKKKVELLLQRIDNCCESMEGFKSNHVKLMLYFDESHVLTAKPVPRDPDQKDMYDVLCSCFNFFLSLPVFVIFLSTTSNINELAPSGSLAKSARARANADALQAPVTETPFDWSPEFPIKPGKFGLGDVSRVEFMAQFGRPM
jgi:hypothetical protein